ncbi:hypothetical protein [Hyalangium versicolor]|uniref:hypothetical protein n=1 Tax=Hyalangium versicolor TaxID=2861190 RepID=UPI001CCF98FF|nr:hypothetical protein [Hyalangium versicolor]
MKVPLAERAAGGRLVLDAPTGQLQGVALEFLLSTGTQADRQPLLPWPRPYSSDPQLIPASRLQAAPLVFVQAGVVLKQPALATSEVRLAGTLSIGAVQARAEVTATVEGKVSHGKVITLLFWVSE